MRVRLLIVPLLATIAACTDTLTSPNASAPRFTIADAPRDYKPGFYWLPPMVQQPDAAGTFDASLSPTVQICELVEGACGAVVAAFDAEVREDHYHVNWHTDEYGLDMTRTYRITVSAGVDHVVLGYADVQPAPNGSGLKNLDNDELMGLVDGRTLPIKFRIETGMIGRVEVQPLSVTAEPGTTQQFVATVTDLHGNPLGANVMWSSSDENVATIDQNGLATAVAEGVAVIMATVDRVGGSATFTVEEIERGTVHVTTGDVHSCALNEDGVAYCWGQGMFGQLGNGLFFTQVTPVLVAGGRTFTAISAAESYTCALTAEGQAYCWGLNNVGQLGNGMTTNTAVPGLVSGDHRFTAIATGDLHACGLADTGQIYCWGFGAALGNGSTMVRTAPTLVAGTLTFSALTAGRTHTCALTSDGTAYCWGVNLAGQLGNGTQANALVPTAVSGGLRFTSIAGGDAHTCAVTATGEAHCWGNNELGRLGIGSTTPLATVPQLVAGGLSFGAISAGEAHSCAITASGNAYCWGWNDSGRLGIGTTDPLSLVPVAVAGGLLFTSIDVGDHSCGVTTANQIYCWGPGGGRLGNGSTMSQSLPTLIAALPES